MSTKCTLVSGKNFQLFEEALDPASHVWLDLKGCAFEATKLGLRVEIPLTIWEVIRQHTTAHYDLAALSDAQLRAEAEKQADANRAEYLATLAEHRAARKASGGKQRHRAITPLFYRNARLPREKHVAAVVAKLRAERSAQRKLQRDIARLSTRPNP